MKLKQIRLVIAIVLLLSLTLCLVACDFTYFDSDKKLKIKKDVEITIVDGERQYTETVTEGETPTIEALYKPGYYLDGFYDESGTKYFDSLGKSTVQWGSNCPSKFYAKWEKLSTLIDIGDSGNFNSFGKAKYYYFDLNEKWINAIDGNQENELVLELTYNAYEDTFLTGLAVPYWVVGIGNTDNYKERLTGVRADMTSKSQKYTSKLYINASDLTGRRIYYMFIRGEGQIKEGHVCLLERKLYFNTAE